MVKKLFKKLIKTINFLRYRFRYLSNYIIIGFLSVLLEIIIVNYSILELPFILKVVVGFIAGVLLAFILNAKLNFRVPKSKNMRTFLLFLIISIIALFLNFLLINLLRERVSLSYSSLRFITAALVFMISYTAHRKITFDFVKKVGIAIYLTSEESISDIYSKIKYYSDFIHIDLVDKSFDINAKEVDLSLIKEINNTWILEKFLHIMSKKPSIWIKKLNKNIDVIIFHLEIDESVEEIIKLCRNYNKKVGVSLTTDSEVSSILKYLPYVDFIQVMGISKIGKAGQLFDIRSIDKVNELNRLKKKYSFKIIFDGGVKPTNINKINAKYIVSASSLLLSGDPIKAFMELKTSSRYYYGGVQLRNDLIEGFKKIVESTDFIESGNIVGSFSENTNSKSFNDIDIVIILNELTKKKFETILNKFEELKQELQSKYGRRIIINNTLGPLKFNIKNIVFHLMLYDIESHKDHCEKSPFTCLDWQRSRIFIKKPMLKICEVKFLQPSYFFSARRSAEEYLSEIRENKVSYREYKFENERVTEEKKYKNMNARDRIEFACHITRFLISNFLKLYYTENHVYGLNEMLKRYFKIFPKNKKQHKKFIKKIYSLKNKHRFLECPLLLKRLELFIKDFEFQFTDYFKKNSTEVILLRHAKTQLNEKKLFVGQKNNPSIIKPSKREIESLKKETGDIDLIFSSPLKRCEQSLKLITSKKIIFDDRLKEIDYGDVSGKSFEYLASRYPKIIEAWDIGEDPKFPNGENTRDVAKRSKDFLNELSKYKNQKILVCAHNVVLRTLVGRYFKISLRKLYKIKIPYLSPIKFIITKDNKAFIELNSQQAKEIFKNL